MKPLFYGVLCFFASACIAGSVEQTNWSGGGGVPGPVTDWGTAFDTVSNIDWFYSPGLLRLGGSLITPVLHLLDDAFFSNCIQTTDINGDGDSDVLSCSSTIITWWRNEGGGTAWTVIPVSSDSPGSAWVDAGDIDGDGDTDVVLAVRNCADRGLYWFENTDGSGTGWVENKIIGFFDAYRVCVSDINGDGKLDITFTESNSDSICWYQNVDGLGMNWQLHVSLSTSSSQRSLETCDLDGDEDLDLLSANSYDVIWFENTDGSGSSMTMHPIDLAISPWEAAPFDIDGDGDLDVFAGHGSGSCWYENLNGAATQWTFHQVSYSQVSHIGVLDADADSDGDLLTVSSSYSLWLNQNGLGTSWTQCPLEAAFMLNCGAGDLDGDGFGEALACKMNGDLVWYRMIETSPSGQLTGSILDSQDDPVWGTLDWTEECPSGSDITMEVRGGYTPGSMGAWITVTSPGDPVSSYLYHHPYFQYRVNLELGTASNSPELLDLTVDWNSTGAAGGQGTAVTVWSLAALENPAAAGLLSIDLMTPQAGPVIIRLHDITGRIVTERTVQAGGGHETVSFTGLPSGVFLCTAQAQGYSGALRVVIID